MDNFEIETFQTRAERDARWEELMLVKPHVVRDTTTVTEGIEGILKRRAVGHMAYRVLYPRVVLS